MSPFTKQERDALIVARAVFRSILEHDPGPCVEQNDCRSDLTVDATFDASSPPLAVEVTRLSSEFDPLDMRALKRLAKVLKSHARGLDHPDWHVALRSGVQLRGKLTDALKRCMQFVVEGQYEGIDSAFPSRFIKSDILGRFERDFHEFLDHLRALGVMSVERASDGRGIFILPIVEISDHQSLVRPLERVVEDNRQKLQACSNLSYQTVLLVEVLRTDALRHLDVSRGAPGLKRGIDRLWLFSRSSDAEDEVTVWLSDRLSRTWRRETIALDSQDDAICGECD